MNQKGFGLLGIIFAIITIIIIGGSVFYFTSVRRPTNLLSPLGANKISETEAQDTKQPTPTKQVPSLFTTPLAGGKVITNGYHYDLAYKQGPVGNVLNDHLVFVSSSGEKIIVPDNIWFLIYAGSAFEKTGKRGGQNLTSFDMPIHPLDKDIIFLSTSESLNETYSFVNRIYSYNLKTTELKEIYSEVAENNSPRNPHYGRILRTVGIDGSKIVVLYDNPDNSPGPCLGIWYHYRDQMGYLELADMQSGLKSYTVPTYKVEEDRIDIDKCLKELELE